MPVEAAELITLNHKKGWIDLFWRVNMSIVQKFPRQTAEKSNSINLNEDDSSMKSWESSRVNEEYAVWQAQSQKLIPVLQLRVHRSGEAP